MFSARQLAGVTEDINAVLSHKPTCHTASYPYPGTYRVILPHTPRFTPSNEATETPS